MTVVFRYNAVTKSSSLVGAFITDRKQAQKVIWTPSVGIFGIPYCEKEKNKILWSILGIVFWRKGSIVLFFSRNEAEGYRSSRSCHPITSFTLHSSKVPSTSNK